MSSFLRRFGGDKGGGEATTSGADVHQGEVLRDGGLKYTVEHGGNNSKPSYQETSGAPVEHSSPLGYTVGPITILFLNLSKMVGTGVYSTPASVLTGTGSVGLALIYWFLGFLIAASSLGVYLEYASYFPNRSGSEVVYLEQAYPRPKYLFPTAFAFQTIILSFSSSNAIVLARYLFRINGHIPSDWELKGVAIAGYTIAVLLLMFHTRASYWLSNGIGAIKLLTLIFVAITGLVVLGGHTRVENPTENFRNAFSETSTEAYGLTNALVKIIFSYTGYENAFNVVNEVKNPVKTIKKSSFIALFVVAVLYEFANIAYFAAVPKSELKSSNQIAASLFFQKVFGNGGAVRGLNFLIALSSFGNLLAVLLGSSRLIRECGRQGVLPYPRFWASTKPFGTPWGPYLVKWVTTIIMIVAPPAGDAFNFAVNLGSYPSAFFAVTMASGLFLVRHRRKKLALGASEFRAWDFVVVFNILANLFILVMPWYPPNEGDADVSFWYGTYVVVGIAIIVLCGIYYAFWVYILPKWGKYTIRQELVDLDGGAATNRLVKVPNDELARWDETHDDVGRLRVDVGSVDFRAGEKGSDGKGSDVDSARIEEVKV